MTNSGEVVNSKIMDADSSSEEYLIFSNSNVKNVNIANTSVSRLRRKKIKKGIIFLSTIPPFMNVTKITEIMSQYGEVGRVFLQPAKTKGKKPSKHFTEGWVEFLSKRVAKEVAENLNNTTIGGRKKSRFYDYIWNLKYLPRFKWVHLNERLEYERAVMKQKLRTEIELAKRESSHFAQQVELSEKLKKTKNRKTGNVNAEENHQNTNTIKQRKTDKEIRNKKQQASKEDRSAFLKNLFVK
ncbi:uncharacterized protein LOC128989817 [Macrosteles quadrilineatus]|uniref:uncharacterized protein LOC128989817 n=1 Tax=Macrosteles quadrilineatus TaxID=74068 RepID=UPI0023E2CD48|nr:uncharacterized protein LOC128989817 [Macrosteles quadrilineatus]